jgi:serine/threonine protein kinase
MRQVGKYQLIRKLATGGMAEVYLAKAAGPMGFEKTLVLKCILPQLAEEPSFVEMFLSEAKLAARLNHSHIAQIFDFGEADGAYFIAMEYIDGPSLGALIKKAALQELALPPALCARLVAEACEGLAFAHDFSDPETRQPLHLIHRDVSPDNLLLSRQGELKVVDFGIAKAAGQAQRTQVGTVKGKLAYMAPEQLRGDPMDRRADVYALGVVLYELLTGHRPYESKSKADLMRAILQDPPTPAVTFRTDLPEPLRRILDQALARDPDLRYPDCAGFQADLEEFIVESGKPVAAQHIAQLITQLDAVTELPELPRLDTALHRKPGLDVPGLVPRPGPAHAREPDDELPELTLLATSIHKPAPGVALGEDSTGEMAAPRTQEMKAAEEPSAEFPARSLPVAPSSLSLKVRSAARASHERGTPPRRLRPWMLALAAVVLLVGVELLLWRATLPPEPPPLPAPSEARLPPPDEPAEPPVPDTAPETLAPEPEPAAPQVEPTAPLLEPPDARSVTREPRGTPSSRTATRGSVVFRIPPNTSVFVDGKHLGDSPLAPASLPAGRHTVKLVNTKLARTVTRHIEVKPEQTTLLKVNFTEE